MKKIILALTLTTPLLSHAQEVKPAGIQVVWQDLKKEFDGFQTLNSEKGTKLALYLQSNSAIIGFDRENISIDSFTDNKDQNLDGEIDFFAKTSKDGKTARFTIKSQKAPAPGATALIAKGTINIFTASIQKPIEVKDVELKKDTELAPTPDFKCTIKDAAKPKWGDKPWSIELKFKFNPETLANVTFQDAEGNAIASEKNGSSHMAFGGSATYTITYLLDKKIDTGGITFHLWQDAKKSAIPFDLTVPLAQP